MEVKTNYPFRPVRCLEEDLETLAPIEGYVLFTTDTRKIYTCINGEYQMMGGSSGVFYANKYLTDEEKFGDQIIFSFLHIDIDGNSLPGVDDLILNIPDGGFYRTLEVTDFDIQAQRIAISGGGSGSGGGPGGGPSNEGSLMINYITPRESSTITGIDYFIEFEIVAKDSAGDEIVEEGSATWIINGKNYYQKVYSGKNSFKVDEYLDPSLDKNKLVLMVTMNTGGINDTTVSKTWNVKAVDLRLKWDFEYDEKSFINTDTFQLSFYPYGGVNCTAHIIFDDERIPGKYFTKEISARETGTLVYSNPIPALEYGSHTCEIYLTTVVNGEDYYTPSVTHEITFIKGGNTTILTVPYYKEVATQYDTLKIPFMVFDPDLDSCDVSFYVNDIRVGGGNYGRTLQYWPYTLNEYGSVKLSIKTDNGDAAKNMELIVNKINLDVAEPSGAIFSLKAINFSSNDELISWESNSADKVTLEFSENFDWENGGLKFETKADGSIEKFIRVRQGTRMTIKYKPFAKQLSNNGKNFKINFRATNCYDYSAPLLNCYDENSKLGIRLEAQQAIFSSDSFPNFATQYFENSYIELETEIWPDVKDPDPENNLYGDRFIMFWVDGIPAGVKAYSRGENFQQLNAEEIVVGSNMCDVDIYVMKVYDRRLTENEHLDNFIMDAPSTEKMLERYNRNNILDNTGEISYIKLVEKNPDCHVYMYDVSRMPTGKTADGEDDIVSGCVYTELFQEYNTLNNPYYTAQNADIYVQGTSSAAYGAAAFNLRTEFPEGLTDKEGNKVEGWLVTPNAKEIDLACTKVNVASCENCNNVVNAEWYNKFQPYHDAHRRKGEEYRDTMQFESGVLFIKDNNPIKDYLGTGEVKDKTSSYLKANCFLDTEIGGINYSKKPYYKMYAIGNMGNDKKNRAIFHDRDNIKACCVEVLDNQNAKHWMTDPNLDISDFVLSDEQEGFYEFRFAADKSKADIPADYKDGKEYRNEVQVPAFLDFVKWMATNDPSPLSAEHPSGFKPSRILQAEVADVNAKTYKKNVYFIKVDGKYIKALEDFDNATTYYNIVAIDPEGDEALIQVKFEPYTFKGFDPPGYEGTENPTKISLKGFIVNDFADVYSYDTQNYRIAKMLSECEDHLVMDSVMFHYLFIQRHTMVDNVAKNTFWSTEDLVHWDLTKNYDNDTSDGNNNSGYLTFTYGIENLDKTDAGADIFNASPSVWINFCHALSSAQKKLHQALATKGAWEASGYLTECSRHQDRIPERCWIYNYFHHYIRPRRLGLDENTFLNRLEGGKKTHQRRQYENYQEFYLNSKYLAGTQFTDSASVDMRLNKKPTEDYEQCTEESVFSKSEIYYIKNENGEYIQVQELKKEVFDANKTSYYVLKGSWDPNNALTVSFYTDCYPSIHIGGQTHRSAERLKRGEFYNLPVGTMIQSANDSTCYLYGAAMLQTLTGLATTYPSYVKLANAGKLREIAYGSNELGYSNPNLTSLDIGSNAMLQSVQAQNSGQRTGIGSADLTKATQLQELLLNGSTLKALDLPEGGIVKNIKLNALNKLKMVDLTMLETVEIDEGIYNINNGMNDLKVKNCPMMDPYTYRMALEAPMTKYEITDFNWIITNINDLAVEGGQVVGIKVLDKLMTKLPNTGEESTSLIGNIHINVECNLDEYEIYKKYCQIYSNLTITYGDIEGLNPAVEIKFMSNDTIDSSVHYRVLGSGDANGATIGTLISEEGPTGIAMTDPTKSDTSEFTYRFSGYWKDASGNKYYKNGLENPEATAKNFSEIIPTTNIIFYPIFIEEIKKHEIKFYDYFGNVILQNEKEFFGVPYGSTYAAAGGPMTNFYYLDSGDLPDNQRYGFQGWTTAKYQVDEGKNIEFIDLKTYVVKKSMNLYPYYVTEDVETVATSEDYFQVINGIIQLKDEFTNSIAGKITIPEMSGAHTVGSMHSAPGITHIYFLRNSKNYTKIGRNAFSRCYNLIQVKLPNSITEIDYGAFYFCGNLETINLHDNIISIGEGAFQGQSINPMKVSINELPSKLQKLGDSAFNRAGINCIITKIPDGIEKIPYRAFYGCPNVKISEFGGNNSKLHTIGNEAFETAGKGDKVADVTSMTIHASVTTIEADAFLNYGKQETFLEVKFPSRTQEEAESLASQAGFYDSVVIVGSSV